LVGEAKTYRVTGIAFYCPRCREVLADFQDECPFCENPSRPIDESGQERGFEMTELARGREPELCPDCNGVGEQQIARWNPERHWHYQKWGCVPCNGTGNKHG
jgi:hypothetical protein